jgi:hypothetical protein
MSLVEFNLIRHQKLNELIPERSLPMMFLLVRNARDAVCGCVFPGVRCAHPGLYAIVRFADCS